MPAIHPAPIRNRLLASLAPADVKRLRPHLHRVALILRHILAPAGKVIEHVYFPESGIVSLVARLDDGAMIEIGLIGKEGLAGAPVLLGADTSPAEMMVQVAGSAWRIETGVLRAAVGRSAALSDRLLRYIQALYTQVSQTAACNGRHPVQGRLARWLLMAHDRMEGDEVPLSQEFLSVMLGVRRSGVTVAAGALKKAGLIDHRQGCITI